MKYRVTLTFSWHELYFDFNNVIDALTFMDAAVNQYIGSTDDTDEKATAIRLFMEIVNEK